MLLNQKLKVWVIDPIRHGVPEALSAFDYDLCVRGGLSPTPEWLGYLKDQKWDEGLMLGAREAREERSRYVLPISWPPSGDGT